MKTAKKFVQFVKVFDCQNFFQAAPNVTSQNPDYSKSSDSSSSSRMSKTSYLKRETDYRTSNISKLTQKSKRKTSSRRSMHKREKYTGAQIIQISKREYTHVRPILKIGGAEIWGGNKKFRDILVYKESLPRFYDVLKKRDMEYLVKIPDLQQLISKERRQREWALNILKNAHYSVSWITYHTLDEIHTFLEELADEYPDKIEVISVGKTFEGRCIKVALLRSKVECAQKMWIDGGIHAREWITPAAVTYILKKILLNRDNEDEAMNKLDFFIAPVLNPDGYEYSHNEDRFWRKNRRLVSKRCSGVDLNRNFSGDWASAGYCGNTYSGPSSASEPETREVAGFIQLHRKNMKAFVSFHSYSQVVLYPKNKGPDTPDVADVARGVALEMGKVNGSKYDSMEIKQFSPCNGTSVKWAHHLGIPYSFAIELRPRNSGTYLGFMLPADQIRPTAKEAFAAIRYVTSLIVTDKS